MSFSDTPLALCLSFCSRADVFFENEISAIKKEPDGTRKVFVTCECWDLSQERRNLGILLGYLTVKNLVGSVSKVVSACVALAIGPVTARAIELLLASKQAGGGTMSMLLVTWPSILVVYCL